MNPTLRQSGEPQLNAEIIWSLFKETDRQIKDAFLETDRRFKETDRKIKETDRQIKDAFLESDRKFQEMRENQEKEAQRLSRELEKSSKKLDKKLGELTNRMGEVIENMMTPGLHKKFAKLGYNFTRFSREHQLEASDGRFIAEIDVFVENGDYALAVEVKTKVTTEDVKEHIARMNVLRKYADEHNDKRKYLGAIASPIITKNAEKFIHKAGFFAIEVSGEAVNITVPQNNDVRKW